MLDEIFKLSNVVVTIATTAAVFGSLVSVLLAYWTNRRVRKIERTLYTKEGPTPRTISVEDTNETHPGQPQEASDE